MNILSVFDGISCGQLALKRAGIQINTYYASEINPDSIKITQNNFSNTIQLGDVQNIKVSKLEKINGLIGGSPCEDLSITAVDRKDINNGLKGSKSILFYNYLSILYQTKPDFFLFENVASMTDKNKNVITQELGVKPILINSNLISAQDRERLYWTNITGIEQPKNRGLILKDILENKVDEKYYYDKQFEFYGLDKKICGRLQVNTHDLCKRVYNPNFSCATLTAVRGGYQEKKVYDNGRVRKLTPIEYERLQTLPDNYTYGIKDNSRRSVCGDGWTIDVITHILSYLNKTNIIYPQYITAGR